jgi:opacity protein-like surface antigen
MRNLNKIILFSAAAFLATSSAFAANAVSKGVYVQGDLGYGTVNADLDDAGWYNASVDKNGLMGDINIGYKFTDNLALEAGFAKFSDESLDSSYSFLPENLTTENHYFDIAGKFILPFNSGFDLSGKLGIALAHTNWDGGDYFDDQDYTKTVGYFGVGADYFLTPNFALTAQFTSTTKSGDEVPAMYAETLGITYLFGSSSAS